jgi:hypothetical protein
MSYYEATDQTEAETENELWHVQLASGDVCVMSLEQLDDAFQTGVISENTYLWQEGATGWVTLREVAGLDADEPEDVSEHAEPQANPFVQTDYASESVWPAAAPAPAYNYAAQDPFAPPVQVAGPYSTAPMVSPTRDMDFDIEPVNFGRKKHPGRWLVAAALVGAAGFGAVKYNLVPIAHDEPAAAAVPPSIAAIPLPVDPPAPAAVTPPPTPAAATPAPDTKPALADDVKDRLAKADKALAAKQAAKQQQAQQKHSAGGHSSSRRNPSNGAKGVFTKGGETGDPLNSSL